MATTISSEQANKAAAEETQKTRGLRRRLVAAGVVLALAIAAFAIWKIFFAAAQQPANVVFLSGRIEGDDSAVAAKVAGRLVSVSFREGDSVKEGEVIALLDDAQVRAREEQARAGVAQAEARLRGARQQIAILDEQIRQNTIEKTQSATEAEGRVSQAQAELAAAESELAQQQSSYQLAVFDRDAYTRLMQTGAVSERQGKQAQTTAAAQEAAVAAAKRRVEAARGALTAAQSALKNPDIRSRQIAALEQQVAQQHAEIASAAADEQRANAQLEEARADRNDLRIKAPFDGTIVTRTAEPGEMLNAGTPVVTLLDLHKVYLRGYIPEGEIGRVKVGQPARVYLDSNPKQPLEAVVLRIDPQATFTPENTYFRNDRVKQVVGVKLGLKSGFGYAKPGMPADGEILTAGSEWPAEARHK
ncbi:MAG TPA: HlyD family efflux transporter periplasmic adaptor subunit [Bryobacteraceae bacterium]|jgi:HlyD family secretion protein